MSDFFQIRSDVRRRSTRLQRITSPQRHRFSQYLFSGKVRLVRNRTINVSRQIVMENLEELKAKSSAGILSVLTPDGRAVDLNDPSLAVISTIPVPPPLPHPPLDSVANDDPSGIPMPTINDGMVASDAEGAAIAEEMAQGALEEAERHGIELNAGAPVTAEVSNEEAAPTKPAKKRDRR